MGFAAACNQAAEVTSGRYLYILNSDAEIEKNVIESVVCFGDLNHNAGVIGTKVVLPDGKLQENFYKFPSLLSELVFFAVSIIKSWDCFLFRLNKYKNYPSSEPFEVDVIMGCSMFIKQEVYKKIRLFDERFFMYYEVSEYCYRLKKTEFKCIYFPAVSVRHYHMGSGEEDRKNYKILIICFNSASFYFKCVKGTLYENVFKLISFSMWGIELMLMRICFLFIKKEKLKKKINMLNTLLNSYRKLL